MTNGNVGHGHVHPRPDGVKARCGGPAICSECARDYARDKLTPPDVRIEAIARWKNRTEAAEAKLAQAQELMHELMAGVDHDRVTQGCLCRHCKTRRFLADGSDAAGVEPVPKPGTIEAKDEELALLRRVIQRAKIPLEEMAKSIPDAPAQADEETRRDAEAAGRVFRNGYANLLKERNALREERDALRREVEVRYSKSDSVIAKLRARVAELEAQTSGWKEARVLKNERDAANSLLGETLEVLEEMSDHPDLEEPEEFQRFLGRLQTHLGEGES